MKKKLSPMIFIEIAVILKTATENNSCYELNLICFEFCFSSYDQKFIVYDSTFSYKGNKSLSLVAK